MQYVYLIKSDRFYKIGIANDPQNRLAQLQTGNPYQLEIVSCYGFKDAAVVEKALHQAFSELNVRNEWFLLSKEQIDTFNTLCRLLGGVFETAYKVPDISEVDEAEDMQETSLSTGGKWDYAAMFADGWRIGNQDSRGLYWNWKRSIGVSKRETIYGGSIASLPYPMDEMRKMFGGS